jgi:hypothetical protein
MVGQSESLPMMIPISGETTDDMARNWELKRSVVNPPLPNKSSRVETRPPAM